MKRTMHEGGQALILIVFGIVGLVGLTALAVDGGAAYSDRRNAQGAADTAALAAALANTRGRVVIDAGLSAASNAGYGNSSSSSVTVTPVVLPSGTCPNMSPGEDITVEITSHVKTYFAPVVGVEQITNTVRATARSCGSYQGPMMPGNAIVSLAPTGNGFDAHGTPTWNIVGGGIFSNSTSSSAETCGGNAGIVAPSATTVGGSSFSCHTVTIPTVSNGAHQYTYTEYASLLPRTPACDGTASLSSGVWVPQAGKDGSRVAFSGDMQFSPGLYCVTNSPGPFHGQISGTWVTFYLVPSGFSMKFNGGGNLTATAPITGEYRGVLMFSAAQVPGGTLQDNQDVDFRGNGSGDITGSVILPSGTVTMFGNSNSNGYHTQIIAYNVDTGGNADININFQAGENYQAAQPAWLTLLK